MENQITRKMLEERRAELQKQAQEAGDQARFHQAAAKQAEGQATHISGKLVFIEELLAVLPPPPSAG